MSAFPRVVEQPVAVGQFLSALQGFSQRVARARELDFRARAQENQALAQSLGKAVSAPFESFFRAKTQKFLLDREERMVRDKDERALVRALAVESLRGENLISAAKASNLLNLSRDDKKFQQRVEELNLGAAVNERMAFLGLDLDARRERIRQGFIGERARASQQAREIASQRELFNRSFLRTHTLSQAGRERLEKLGSRLQDLESDTRLTEEDKAPLRRRIIGEMNLIQDPSSGGVRFYEEKPLELGSRKDIGGRPYVVTGVDNNGRASRLDSLDTDDPIKVFNDTFRALMTGGLSDVSAAARMAFGMASARATDPEELDKLRQVFEAVSPDLSILGGMERKEGESREEPLPNALPATEEEFEKYPIGHTIFRTYGGKVYKYVVAVDPATGRRGLKLVGEVSGGTE